MTETSDAPELERLDIIPPTYAYAGVIKRLSETGYDLGVVMTCSDCGALVSRSTPGIDSPELLHTQWHAEQLTMMNSFAELINSVLSASISLKEVLRIHNRTFESHSNVMRALEARVDLLDPDADG